MTDDNKALNAALRSYLALSSDGKRQFSQAVLDGSAEIHGVELGPPSVRFQLLSADDALAPLPEIKNIVEGLITESSVVIFYGDAGSGKSMIAMCLGVCTAAGSSFLRHETHPRAVLYVDEENGRIRFLHRLAKILKGVECGPEIPFFGICQAGFNLQDDLDRALLVDLIQEKNIGLVILDSLADFTNGDENSKQDTQPVFSALRKIAETTGAAFVILHHSNKTGGYRGSTAIKGAVDLMVLVEKDSTGTGISFTTEKNRDGEKSSWRASATWGEDSFSLVPVDKPVKEDMSANEREIINYLTEKGMPAKRVEIIDHCMVLGSGKEAAIKAIGSLNRSGKIYRVNPDEKGQGAEAVYSVRSS